METSRVSLALQVSQMKKWDCNNEKIIEVRYEDILDYEYNSFKKIFLHYELHPKLMERGLELVEKYSLKNQRGKIAHIRNGKTRQWMENLTPLHKNVFKHHNGDLLIKLGYEKDHSW